MSEQVNAVPQVYAGILKASQLIGRVGVQKLKDGDFGQGAKRKYRSIDDVYDNLNECLAEAGIVIIPTIEECDYKRYEVEKSGNGGSKYTQITYVALVTMRYRVFSALDGSFVESVIKAEGFDNSDKAVGKALSYAYKNYVIQLLCIPVHGNAEPEQDNITRPEPESPRPGERSRANGSTVPRASMKAEDVPNAWREQQKSPAADKLAQTEKPAGPVVRLKTRKDDGEPLASLNDDNLAAYVRQLHHVRDSLIKKAESARGTKQEELLDGVMRLNSEIIPEAVKVAEDRKINWKKDHSERTQQLADAVNGKPSVPLDQSVHPDFPNSTVSELTAAQMSRLISYLDSVYVGTDKDRRKAVVEMAFTALQEREAAAGAPA